MLPSWHACGLIIAEFLFTYSILKKKVVIGTILIMRVSIARSRCTLGKWFYDFNLLHQLCPEALIMIYP